MAHLNVKTENTAIYAPVDKLQDDAAPTQTTSGYFDAFMGLANTYVGAAYSESAREAPEQANQARGNTETIYQPQRGVGQAGETILAQQPINMKKVAIYSAMGLGALVTLGVIYKVVK